MALILKEEIWTELLSTHPPEKKVSKLDTSQIIPNFGLRYQGSI